MRNYFFVLFLLGTIISTAHAQSVVLTARNQGSNQPALRSLHDRDNPFVQHHVMRPTSAQITTYYSENFDSGIPSAWTVVDSAGTGYVWQGVNDYSGSTLDGTPFAMIDSDAAGHSDVDTYLISPVITVSAAPGQPVLLTFDQFFNSYSGNEIADVDVWDGSQWVNVLRQQGYDVGSWGNPDNRQINVTSYINPQFKVRFHYYNANYDWYWAVDNVQLISPNDNDLYTAWGAPFTAAIGEDVVFSLVVGNNGANEQNDFTTYVTITDTLDTTVYYTDTLIINDAHLPYEGIYKVNFPDPWTATLAEGEYHIHFGVILPGDEEPSNNEYQWNFYAHQFGYTDNRVYTAIAYDSDNSGDDDHFGWFDYATGTYNDVAAWQNFYGDYYTTGTFVANKYIMTVDNYNDVYLTDSVGNNFLYCWIPMEFVPDLITGLAYDENNPGVLYATTIESLYQLNFYMDASHVGDYTGRGMLGLDIDPSGTLYGIEAVSDSLFIIDPTDATLTGVGHLGFNIHYIQDIGVDDVTGNLYGTLFEYDTVAYAFHSGLYTIDKANGQATLIGSHNYSDEYVLCAPIGNITTKSEVIAEDQWMIYPNPASSYLKVVAPMKVQRVQIMSITGQVLLSENPNSERFMLDIKHLNPGLYLLRIEGDHRSGIRRLMIK